MSRQETISIYDYTDYRRYLSDYYTEQKSKNPAFSYRYFAKRAGFNSSGLYKDIIDGRTGITRGMILRFSKAMKLTKKQEEYFETMVYFNEANSIEEKKLYFERMMRYHSSKAFKVDSDHYEYYAKWYYVAIRELCAIGDFDDDYGRIARSLNPAITKEEAKRAIDVLVRLGLIQKNTNKHYKVIERIVTTGPDIKAVCIANYQKSMMEIAKDAIERHPAAQRNISTITFSVSTETFDEIRAELDACRKRILGMIDRSQHEDRVCQLNIQLFPLTRIQDK